MLKQVIEELITNGNLCGVYSKGISSYTLMTINSFDGIYVAYTTYNFSKLPELEVWSQGVMRVDDISRIEFYCSSYLDAEVKRKQAEKV